MATIVTFEELEIWQLARTQVIEFHMIASGCSLKKDFELYNQMNASAGSVMDCIAEGFERSGNNEFKNFIVIAKGSNGEFRSQLYRCLDKKHISQLQFDKLYSANCVLAKKLMSFIKYLQQSSFKGQSRK